MTIRVEIKNHDANKNLEIIHIYNGVAAEGPTGVIPPGHSEDFWIHDTHDLIVREGLGINAVPGPSDKPDAL